MGHRPYNPHDDLADDAPDLTRPTPTGGERARREGEELDVEWLMAQPQFKRWLLTFKVKARIDERTHWTQETSLAHEAGRRDLGLEVLDDIRAVVPTVDVDLAIEKARTLGARL